MLNKILLTLIGLIGFYSFLAFAQHPAAEDKYAAVAYPPVNYGEGAKAEQIKRGEYLVKAGDCIACHTTPGGKPFAGGLAVVTPFGTIYSQNITPDQQTGIGRWSDDDFVRALREGISPSGEYYFPAFPYNYFNQLSRQDALDIKAYLAAIPAVAEQNHPLDMPWPFRVRLLQSFWRFLFFDFEQGEFIPDDHQSPEWNRGAYLVQGLAHCSLCHSPLNVLGAAEKKYDLAGGFIEGYPAPNISASRWKEVPTAKILRVFLADEKINGGKVQGPMLQVNHDSLRYLTPEDLIDIATYLRTVQSATPPAPSVGTGVKAGENIYQKYCAACHMGGGGGAPKFGNAAQWEPIVKQGMPKVYDNAIKGIDGMPAKGNCESCTDEQIKSAVDYLVGKSTGAAAKPTVSGAPAGSALTSLVRGKIVYDKVCSVCHAQGQLGAPKLGDQKAWEPILHENLDILVSRTIYGYKGHPAKGACYKCNDADIISAVKYMAQESGLGDYRLW